jgi:hypothetical protein
MSKNAELTLYFIPSPKGLNWNTPTSLSRDIVKNKLAFQSHFMGHVNIELKYTNEDGKEIHILTGMVARDLNAASLLFKDGIGLGVVYHSFPGKLENKEELTPELDSYFKIGNKKINFAKYLINNSTAKRIEEYVTQYAEADLGRYYGLVNSPLHGEGAGCSAFGASFMDVAGLLEDEHRKHWANCVKVPHAISGAPLKEKKVSFFKILLGNHSWANESEDHHELFFWDPDLMHAWVERAITNHNQTMSEYTLVKNQESTGIVFDVTHKETPTGPIFKHTDGKPTSHLPDIDKSSNFNKYHG